MLVSEVKELAEKEYTSHGEIDIVKLCNSENIAVFSDNKAPEGFNAKIAFSKKRGYEITFNSNHPFTRIRFSIAHELAHFYLHKDSIQKKGVLHRSVESDSLKEKEADALAGEILMPEKSAIKLIHQLSSNTKQELSRRTISSFAKKFEVSLIASAVRIRELGFEIPYISNANA